MVKDIFSDFPSCKFSIITKYIIINEVTTETFTFTLANALNVIDGTSQVVLLPQIFYLIPLWSTWKGKGNYKFQLVYSLFNGLTIYFLVDLIITSKSNQLH